MTPYIGRHSIIARARVNLMWNTPWLRMANTRRNISSIKMNDLLMKCDNIPIMAIAMRNRIEMLTLPGISSPRTMIPKRRLNARHKPFHFISSIGDDDVNCRYCKTLGMKYITEGAHSSILAIANQLNVAGHTMPLSSSSSWRSHFIWECAALARCYFLLHSNG